MLRYNGVVPVSECFNIPDIEVLLVAV